MTDDPLVDVSDDDQDNDDDDNDENMDGKGSAKRGASRKPASSSFGMQRKRDELAEIQVQIRKLKHFV